MALMRLDKFISGQLPNISRSNVKNLCKRGYVTVNGRTEKNSEIKIDPDTAKVTVSGREIVYREHLYIMLNKPQGVVCSTKDGLSETVLELLPPSLRRQGLFPAGRLDKDTEGFVLITDDGGLAHRMLSPKSHVPKLYFVRLEKPLDGTEKAVFAKGAVLEDGTECMPAELEGDAGESECLLTLHEGMFHQVKRMFESAGNRVVFLKRIKIGELRLDDRLAPSESRELALEEVKKLNTADK